MELELRTREGLEVRVHEGGGDDDPPTVGGLAVPYDDWTQEVYGFSERFAQGAFRRSLVEDDQRVIFNHNSDMVIGRRSAKTATLRETDRGVEYQAQPPKTSWAADLIVSIRRGDITGNSFGFYVENREDAEWEEKDGILWRTVLRARLV